MIITNLNTVGKFLNRELAIDSTTITEPLTVDSVGPDFVVVMSSRDSDLSMRLHGITGITVGSTLTVDVNSGAVVVVSEKPDAASGSEKKTATPRTPNAAFDPNKYL